MEPLVVRDRDVRPEGAGASSASVGLGLLVAVHDLYADVLGFPDGLLSHGQRRQDESALTGKARPLDLHPRLTEARVGEDGGAALA